MNEGKKLRLAGLRLDIYCSDGILIKRRCRGGGDSVGPSFNRTSRPRRHATLFPTFGAETCQPPRPSFFLARVEKCIRDGRVGATGRLISGWLDAHLSPETHPATLQLFECHPFSSQKRRCRWISCSSKLGLADPPRRHEQPASIRNQMMARRVRPRRTRQIQHRRCHLHLTRRSPRRHIKRQLQVRIGVILVNRAHAARENPRRNRIDPDWQAVSLIATRPARNENTHCSGPRTRRP